MSVITDESLLLVSRFFEARRGLKLGGTLYGPDSSLWPARWYQAVSLLQLEIDSEEAAAHRAMSAK